MSLAKDKNENNLMDCFCFLIDIPLVFRLAVQHRIPLRIDRRPGNDRSIVSPSLNYSTYDFSLPGRQDTRSYISMCEHQLLILHTHEQTHVRTSTHSRRL